VATAAYAVGSGPWADGGQSEASGRRRNTIRAVHAVAAQPTGRACWNCGSPAPIFRRLHPV